MRYERINPHTYEYAKNNAPIAYLPWGAHERHNEHLPLGTDTLKAYGIASELCAKTGGIVYPGIFCGHGTIKEQEDDDCTLEFTRECVELLATEYLEQLALAGFKVIVIIMGHYGCEHMEAIREVVSDFNEVHKSSIAWAATDFDILGHECCPDAYGTCTETSCIMYFRPGLVDPSRMSEKCLQTASSAAGRDFVNMIVESAAAKINDLLNRTK